MSRKRTNGTTRLEHGQFGRSRSCSQGPPTTNLPGRQRGQSENGSLSAEVDVAKLLECRPQRQAGNAAKQGQEYARRGQSGHHDRPRQGQDGSCTSEPSAMACATGSSCVYSESQRQAAAIGNTDRSRSLFTSNGQERVGAGMGSPIRGHQLRFSSRPKLSGCHGEGLPPCSDQQQQEVGDRCRHQRSV